MEQLGARSRSTVAAMVGLALVACTGRLSGEAPHHPPTDSADAGPNDPPPGAADAGDGPAPPPSPADAGTVPPPPGDPDAGGETLSWSTANLTWYTSYPDPDSEECIEYNGCEWAGWFAALDEQQPESWVEANNIAAVHSQHFDTYRLKTLRLRKNGHEIDVVVYDMCADSDCSGCCTANSSETGFLIDIESYTADRFGENDGIVEWACLDCD